MIFIYNGQLIYKCGQICAQVGQCTGQIGQLLGQTYVYAQKKSIYINNIFMFDGHFFSINNIKLLI